MVESKCVVLQMIPHTLFIEWDFRHYSLVVLLFTYTILFIHRIQFIYEVLVRQPFHSKPFLSTKILFLKISFFQNFVSFYLILFYLIKFFFEIFV